MNTKQRLSITKKLVIAFIVAITIPMLVLGVISFLSAKTSLLNGTVEYIQSNAKNYIRILELGYTEASKAQTVNVEYANTLIYSVELDSAHLTPTSATHQITGEKTTIPLERLLINGEEGFNNQKIIETIANKTKSTVTLFQRIPQGFLRISTNVKKQDGTLATGTFIANDSPVAKALLNGDSYFGKAFVVDQWYLTGYKPLKTKDHKIVGAIYTGSSVKSILETFSNDRILDNGYVFIVNKENGKLVMHSSDQNKDLKTIDPPFGKNIYEQIIKSQEGEIRVEDSNSKKFTNVILYYSYFKQMDWYIVAAVYEKDILSPVIQLRNTILIIGVCFILFAIIFSIYFGKKLSYPIIETSANLLRNTEKIDEIVKSLTDASGKLSEGSTRQAASIEETSASLEQISGMANRNQEINQQNDQLASDVLNHTQKAAQNMSELEKAMKEIQESNEKIFTLVDVINNIGHKTQVMDEIVFQTKLLSFNASVEAERAGESGRGFMVVAQEVGNLAALSGKSAKEISQIVKDSVSEAQKLTSHADEKVKDGSKYVKTTYDTMRVITELSSKVKNSSSNILNSFSEQQRGIGQISQAMGDIDEKTQGNALMASKTAEISQELANHANEIKQAAKQLSIHVKGYEERI